MVYLSGRHLVISVWLRAGIVIGLMLSLAVADWAESGVQASNLGDMSLEDLMNVTVVTAGKKAEAISNTPASVFVITREDIERYGYRTLGQALRRISGFYSEYDYAYDYIGVRGYLPNRDLNRRVLVLVDGHKVNDYLYGQAPVNNDLPVDMRDLDRIEVVKGPGSALWGSEALLCVVNCITKSASEAAGYHVGQDLGFRNGQRLALGQSTPGGLQVTGSVEELKSDGQRSIYFPDYDIEPANSRAAKGMDSEQVGRGFINMAYSGFKFTYNHVDRVKDLPTAAWGAVLNQPDLSLGDERHFWEFSYGNPKPYAADGALFCRVYQDNYDAVCHFNWLSDDNVTIVHSRGRDICRAYGTELRYSRSISSSLSAILGSEYVRNYQSSRTNYIPTPYSVQWAKQGSFDMLSYYSQAEWDATKALRFVAGTRFDDHSIFGGTWSPRLAAIYKRSAKTTYKFLYGEALRMPSLDEYMLADPGTVLKPEKIVTNEFVWEQQMGGNAQLVTSLFGYRMCGLIGQAIDSIHSGGIETQYERRLRNGGSSYLGLSYVDAKSAAPGTTLASSPNWLVTSGLSVPTLGNRAYLAAELQYVSSSKTNMHQVAPAYAVANLALTSSSILKNSDVSLGITNLFNTPYVVNARPEDYQDKMPQPDRTLEFQISYNL